jgi:hypothetical protein
MNKKPAPGKGAGEAESKTEKAHTKLASNAQAVPSTDVFLAQESFT